MTTKAPSTNTVDDIVNGPSSLHIKLAAFIFGIAVGVFISF